MSQHGARDVGEMGETTLSLWCASVGITANRVQIDKTAWDHFLELPDGPEPLIRGGALDTAPAPPKCLVQVKATDRSDPVVPVTLANLHRLVTSVLPSFYLLLQFDGTSVPIRAHLLHCDRRLAAAVLKRMRELSAESNARELLQKRNMNIRFGSDELLAGLGGAALLVRLRTHIGADFDSYCARKRGWVQAVGYEQGFSQVSITFESKADPRTPQELWIDFTLGLEPELPIARAEIRDIRFGIPSPQALAEFGSGGTLRIETPGGIPAAIELRVADGRTVRIEGHAILPLGVNPETSPAAYKVRFTSTFTELLVHPLREGGESLMTFSLPGGDSKCALRELARLSQFILAYANAASNALEVQIALEIAGKRLVEGTVGTSINVDEDVRGRCEAAQHAWELVRAFELDEDMSVLVSDLLDQQKLLSIVRTVVLGDPDTTDIQVGCDDEIADIKDEVCAPMAFAVQLGEEIVLIARAYCGVLVPLPSPRAGGKTHRLTRVRVRQFKTIVVPQGQKLPYGRDELLNEMALALGTPGQVIKYWA